MTPGSTDIQVSIIQSIIYIYILQYMELTVQFGYCSKVTKALKTFQVQHMKMIMTDQVLNAQQFSVTEMWQFVAF